MSTEQDFLHMLKSFYEAETPRMRIENHVKHNDNPEYWSILLGPLNEGDWSEKTTLDFGCGCGRNVINVLEKFKVKEAHGCDISSNNIKACEELVAEKGLTGSAFFTNDPNTLAPLESDKYDLITSIVVLQHIPCHSVRKSLMTDMYRVMKTGGILSIQMGFGPGHPSTADYYDNAYHASSTNSAHDVKVSDPQQIVDDLAEIGFKNIETKLARSWLDWHQQWIYVKAVK